MIIHYYKQFFPGPNSVGPRQPRELARRLAEAGHEVHVITNDFNAYNEAAEPDEHHRGESAGSWRVHRLPTPRNMRASLAARLRTYVTFGARAIRYGLTLPVPQVVIGQTAGAGHFCQVEVPDQVNAMMERFLTISGLEPS